MSERKVLNKYYPPDFDPSNIPKMKTQKNRPFNIRIMAPMNMRCDTCGEYIYKGKKFNSRKEDVEDEFYLGLRIFRFYIKCPRCVSEIAFKTDLENTDYTLEAGATRLFEAEKLARQMAEKEIKEKEEEELNNPMKVLENRTKASRNEIDQIDTLEELKEMNSRHAKIDHEEMLKLHTEYEKQLQRLQDEEEEKEIRAIFGDVEGKTYKRLHDGSDDDDDEEGQLTAKKIIKTEKATDILTDAAPKEKKEQVWEKSIGSIRNKKSLMNLVRRKPNSKTSLVKRPETEVNGNSPSSSASERLSDTNQDNCSNKLNLGSESKIQNGVTEKTENEDVKQNTGDKDKARPNKIPSALGMLGNYSASDSDSTD